VVNALAGLQVADGATGIGDVVVEDNGVINVSDNFEVSNATGAAGSVSIDGNGEINVDGRFDLGNRDGTTASLTLGSLSAPGENPTPRQLLLAHLVTTYLPMSILSEEP